MLKAFCLTATLAAATVALLPFAKNALGQGCFMQTSDGLRIDLSSLCKGEGSEPVYTARKLPTHNHRNQWGLGLDLPAFCKQRYGPGASVTLQENNALGWKCLVGSQTQDISFEEACSSQYGPFVRPGLGDFSDVRSWHCRLRSQARHQASGS